MYRDSFENPRIENWRLSNPPILHFQMDDLQFLLSLLTHEHTGTLFDSRPATWEAQIRAAAYDARLYGKTCGAGPGLDRDVESDVGMDCLWGAVVAALKAVAAILILCVRFPRLDPD